jgi:hypothetical protein
MAGRKSLGQKTKEIVHPAFLVVRSDWGRLSPSPWRMKLKNSAAFPRRRKGGGPWV